MKHLIPKTMTTVPVLALALAVGGCGSSSDDDEMMAGPTPEEMCTGAGGEWMNGECTTAEELAEARADMQRMAVDNAIMAAQTAVNAVDNDSTDAQVSAADAAVAAARSAIAMAADVPMNEKDANTGTVDALAMQLSGAKTARMAADATEMAEMAEMEAMMAATAAKLYAGISAQMGDGNLTTLQANDRDAAYNADGTAILVSIGGETAAASAIVLPADKDTMVPDNHGWEGKRYAADFASGDMYEAYVYSNVEAPKEGKKFGGAAANDEFEYALSSGMLALISSGSAETAFDASRVDGSSFDHTAGVKQFELPSPNPGGQTIVTISGTFHGVSGTYSCTPGDGNACGVRVAAEGFELGTVAANNTFTNNGGTWTFMPNDANARVMGTMDTMYASYGWWLHKTADGMTYTASAFFDYKGGDGSAELASGLNALNGTATYTGGAAGKYALSSSTGGMNDAGHFTAKAMLEADFTDNMISGTIDNFMGADGMSRDWSVELMDTAVNDTGVIAGDGTSGNDDRQMTKWTIGGTAAAASGEWAGQLYENGTDGVPKTAAGTFFSMYGQGNSMVGAFGATKE